MNNCTLDEEYEHEVSRRALHSVIHESGHALVSVTPRSPGRDDSNQECKNVCGVGNRNVRRAGTPGSGEYMPKQIVRS